MCCMCCFLTCFGIKQVELWIGTLLYFVDPLYAYMQISSWSIPVVTNSTFREPHREFRVPLLWVCSCSLGYHLTVSLGWLFPWNQMICLASVSACSKHTCTCAQMLNPLPWFTMQIYWDIARPLDPVHDINNKNLGVHSGSWLSGYTTPICLHLTTQETSCLVMSVVAVQVSLKSSLHLKSWSLLMRCGHEDLLNMATPGLAPRLWQDSLLHCIQVTHPSKGKTCASAVSKFVAKHLPKFQVTSQANLRQMSRGTTQHFEMPSMNCSCSLLCACRVMLRHYPLLGCVAKDTVQRTSKPHSLGYPWIWSLQLFLITCFRSNVRKSRGHRQISSALTANMPNTEFAVQALIHDTNKQPGLYVRKAILLNYMLQY